MIMKDMKEMSIKQKRVFYALACVAVLLVALGVVYAASDDDKGGNADADSAKCMTVAVTPTLDCLPVYVAVETGIADELGCELGLQQQASIADCDSALVGGSAFCASTDSVRAAMLLAGMKKGVKEKYSIVRNPNCCLFLFANRKARVKKVSQLKDKMIAVDRKGADAVMAQYVLDSVKLVDDKAFLVNIHSLNVRMAMLANNTIDAAVLPEPQATVARKVGHENLYAECSRGGKTYGAFLVEKENKELFVKIYNRACDSINKNGIAHYDSILVRRMSVPEKFVKDIPIIRFVKL
ncbi:ABC transporter substrate-binding protein [Palleniella muris]|uniref:ABC transporter substrate-binding protein n=1 Tax=Palleniella muris TaxID=3038145 RepID=A0AC61QT56_9BACT|nr:ABC transporter substrate-binding protein [Palleniella muris]TGX83369.1 ABC transporter substrate-binding protein [Palleniella muris]